MDRLLPSLDGELGLHAQSGGRTTLLLDARYRPPGGALGGAFDAVAMHRLARTTVERFLEEVTARLAGEALLLDDGPTTGTGRLSPRERSRSRPYPGRIPVS
jgi:hypothetical protein